MTAAPGNSVTVDSVWSEPDHVRSDITTGGLFCLVMGGPPPDTPGGDNGSRGGSHGQDQTERTLPLRKRLQGQALLRGATRLTSMSASVLPTFASASPTTCRVARRLKCEPCSTRSVYLPAVDASLQVRLPSVITADMDRAINALRDDHGTVFDEALGKVVPAVDTLERRILLAQAVIALRDQERIPAKLAAVAVFELDRAEPILCLLRGGIARCVRR